MSEFDSIDHLDIGRYQQSYFANPKQDDDNHNSKKRTGIIDQFSDSLNMPFQFPQNPISEQKISPSQQNQTLRVSWRRPKKIIEVGQKKRSNYLKTKNGSSDETNDLSTYACSIIKSLCDDYMLCELAKEQDKQIIEQFKKSKANINSIQVLLREKGGERGGSCGSNCEEKGWKGEKRELVDYLSKEMGRTQVLKQRVLTSRKMKFSNKIRMIKYIQKIRKSVSNAQQFEGWKKQNF